MNNFKCVSGFKIALAFSLFIFIQFISMPAALAQTSKKGVDPWYIYKSGNSFADIEPLKDIIRSLSIFGNPPKEFIDECHRNNILVYHAVGYSDNKAIDSPDKIKKISDEYVNFCKLNGYDGIDLDFEHLDPDFQDSYSEFLKELSTRLHTAGKKLSHSIGFPPTKGHQRFYDPKVIAETCDLVRVMCYDMHYAPDRADGIGPTSDYSWTKEGMVNWAKYVPVNKLVMALPAYSNDYTMTAGGGGKQVYAAVPDSVNGTLQPPLWQPYERLNIYLYNDFNDRTHLFYASDWKSIKSLLEISDELKINNIGFWHFSSVDPKIWKVVGEWINR